MLTRHAGPWFNRGMAKEYEVKIKNTTTGEMETVQVWGTDAYEVGVMLDEMSKGGDVEILGGEEKGKGKHRKS